MKKRVVVWGTGFGGKRVSAESVRHPLFERVGVGVSNPEKVGKDAGELIHAFSGPLAMKATVFDLLRAPWYHPTLAEIITYPLEEIAEQIKR